MSAKQQTSTVTEAAKNQVTDRAALQEAGVSGNFMQALSNWNQPANDIDEFRKRLGDVRSGLRHVALSRSGDSAKLAVYRQLVAAIPSLSALTPSHAVMRAKMNER